MRRYLPLCLLCLSPFAHADEDPPPWNFDLVPGGNADSSNLYSDDAGYGFEPGAPNQFSMRAHEGNYRVTVRFGDRKAASRTTVKAEARRLMVEDVSTRRGQFTERTFIVNVRTPELAPPPETAPGGTAVRIKPREQGSATWDDKLTLEFLGSAPKVAALTIEPADVPTIYLAGDSTVTDQLTEPGASWGQMLPRFFSSDIAVANHAESGETLKSFITELRLDKLLSRLRAGDWVLIQFGHNDQKAHWPQTYVEAGTTYRSYLRAYIAEARRRGATPILVTSPERRNFDSSGHLVESLGAYPDAVRAVAREDGVALIDLHRMSKAFYEALGETRAPLAFSDEGRDKTHHNNYGAYELARMVVEGIRSADPKLAAHLAKDVQPFDASKPDAPEKFELAASSARSQIRPDGS
jgi:lysophospholipase L1-like esterase